MADVQDNELLATHMNTWMGSPEIQEARIAISVLQSEIEVLNCELDKAYDYTVRLENQIKDAMNTLAGR